MRRIAILGSTGSIGRSALSVVEAHPDRLRVVALAAGRNVDLLADQVARFRPEVAATAEETGTERLRASGAAGETRLAPAGAQGLVEVATHPGADIVLCASSGSSALEAVMAAIEAGKVIALANKEVLVMAGPLVTEAARRRGVPLLPVDSEHNAVHQCLHGRRPDEVARIVLTASGGPFRGQSAEQLDEAGPEEALRHPTWQMGRKITIDSATLMNKGLEVIEAHWLFGLPSGRIDVVIHPQSVVHSMVELTDGSIIAQLGTTDMRLPIQYAFSYPERWTSPVPRLDLVRAGRLDFLEPDREAFPCLGLAYRALEVGGSAPATLNAANEVAVEAFLAGRIGFRSIPRLIEAALDAQPAAPAGSIAEVRAADRRTRERAWEAVRGLELKI